MGFDGDLKAQPQAEKGVTPLMLADFEGAPQGRQVMVQVADAGDQDGQGQQPQGGGGHGFGSWLKRQGDKIGHGAKKLGGEIKEQVQNIDPDKVQDAAKKAINSDVGRAVVGGVTGQQTDGAAGVIGTASRILFPQAQILNIGGREIGGFASRKFALGLLEDPAKMSLKLDGNFDILDNDKDGYIKPNEVDDKSGLTGLLDDSRGLGPILQRGFTAFANLDGKDAELGISRGDVTALKLITNADLRNKYIDDQASSSRLYWGGGGLVASLAGTGAAKYFAPAMLEKVGGARVGLAIAAITTVSAFVGGMWKKHSLSSDFAQKEEQLKSTFESIKAAL